MKTLTKEQIIEVLNKYIDLSIYKAKDEILNAIASELESLQEDNSIIDTFCEKHAIVPQTLIDVYLKVLKDAVDSVQDSKPRMSRDNFDK
jgi:small basic protein